MNENSNGMDRFAAAPGRARFLEELADREAIRDCLWRYCRGIDRCDAGLLRSAFWPDALDSHAVPGKPPKNAYAWIEKVVPRLYDFTCTQHQLTNILIRIDGDRADVESYFWAVHQIDQQGQLEDVHAAGRYLDIMERRGDEWRIANRHVLIDWFRTGDVASDRAKGIFGTPDEYGDRGGKDYSDVFFAKANVDTAAG